MPQMAAAALRQLQQTKGRTTGPVFATSDGDELDAANVRREFRAAVKAAGITGNWSPRGNIAQLLADLARSDAIPVRLQPRKRAPRQPQWPST